MLPLMQRILQTHRILSTARLLPTTSTIQPLNLKAIHMTFVHNNSSSSSVDSHVAPKTQMGYVKKLFKKFGILDLTKYRHMALACLVYEHVLKQIDYHFFYKHFNMSDTLFSWFLVTELHVWMLMVRYMAEGKSGNFIRNEIVTAMWDDTKARTEQLGTILSSLKKKQIQELSDQFNAAIIAYDEGILSDDKVLAGALWRRFFYFECNNPEHVELLVSYVRMQISLFDNLPTEEIFKKASIFKLVNIKSLCKYR